MPHSPIKIIVACAFVLALGLTITPSTSNEASSPSADGAVEEALADVTALDSGDGSDTSDDRSGSSPLSPGPPRKLDPRRSGLARRFRATVTELRSFA